MDPKRSLRILLNNLPNKWKIESKWCSWELEDGASKPKRPINGLVGRDRRRRELGFLKNPLHFSSTFVNQSVKT